MGEINIEKINTYKDELVKILKKSKVDKTTIENINDLTIIKSIQANKKPKDLAWELIHL